MIDLSRRALLPALLATTAVAAVAGCGSLTASQVQADVTTLDDGLAGILAAIQAIPGVSIPAATASAIETEIAAIKANAAQIASAVTSSTVVSGFQSGIGTLGALLAPFLPAAPLVAAAVNAVVSLAGAILSEAGVVSAAAVMGATSRMSPARARAVLQAIAVR